MFCKDCGKKIDSEEKFCWFCDTPIAKSLNQNSATKDNSDPTFRSELLSLDSGGKNLPKSSKSQGKRPFRAIASGAVIVVVISLFFLLNFNSIFSHKKKLVRKYNPPPPSSTIASATTTSPPPASRVSSLSGSNAKIAAIRLNSLLSQSGIGRTTLISTIQGINSCSISPSAATQFLKSVISNRQSLINKLGGAHLAGLPNETQLRSSLNLSWVYSLKADQYFLQWEQQVNNSSCHGQAPVTSAYVNAINESKLATTSKQNFLSIWNPIASQQSLPVLNSSQI